MHTSRARVREKDGYGHMDRLRIDRIAKREERHSPVCFAKETIGRGNQAGTAPFALSAYLIYVRSTS